MLGFVCIQLRFKVEAIVGAPIRVRVVGVHQSVSVLHCLKLEAFVWDMVNLQWVGHPFGNWQSDVGALCGM